MNPITGEGIPDVEMKLLKSTLGLPGGKKSVKEATSNSDGFFEISKSGLNVYYLQCNTSADYYELGWFENGQQISTAATDFKLKMGKTLHADFYAVPYGQLHWHIQNVNCEGSTDTMWYKIKYQYDSDFLSLWSFPIDGCADIIGNGSDKMEMGNHIIYMKIKRPSGTIYKYDTVFVNENGVTNFDLLY
ncbi:MAG: hypothetical protein IT221_08295 [Fluviicola sp.]|nr:hypothetical protein [Fluviicola sp.]